MMVPQRMLAMVLLLVAPSCGGGQRAARQATSTRVSSANPNQEQDEQAIAEIRKRGGTVRVDQAKPGRPAITVSLMGPKIGDADLPLLASFKYLDVLSLKGSRTTNQGLANLPGKDYLRVLLLNGTRVTDGGLAHLRDFSNLETLNLSGTRVSDTGLKHLTALSTLHTLDISGTRVTNVGLRRLKRLSNLERLYVIGLVGVTDAGVMDLQRSLPRMRLHRQVVFSR